MAVSTLGRLTLDLVMKIGSFVDGMNKAERQTKDSTNKMNKAMQGFKDQVSQTLGGTYIGSLVSDFNQKIGSMQGGIAMASAALAGMAVGGVAVAAGALTKMAIDTAKADAQLLVLANRANTSVQSFQVLEFASAQLGMSQDQLGAALADAQEKLGEFTASESGGANDFFEALKNNTKMTEDQIRSFAKTLSGKDGIEAIQAISTELDKLDVTKQERRFVFESLASDMGNLAPLFAENGRLLNQYGEALQDVGVIKTEDAIQKSQLLAAQTQAVNLQFQAWKNQLLSGFMPAIVSVANAFFGTSKNGIELQKVGEGIGSVLKTVSKVALGVSASFNIAGKLIGGVAAAIAALKGEKVATLNLMFEDINNTLADYGARIDSLSTTSEAGAKSSSTLVNAILDVNNASLQAAAGLKTNTKQAEENAKAAENQAKANAKAAKEQENLNKMVGASALQGLRIKSSEAFAGGQVRGYTASFAQMAQKQLGSGLNRFTAFNDLYHKGTNSKHATGNAFDLTLADPSKSAEAAKNLEAMARQYGYIVKVIDEYKNPSKRSTGGHLHVSVLGFKGTAEAAKMAQEELGLVASTNAEAQRLHDERMRAQQSVASRYFTELEKINHDHQQAIKEIEIAYAGDDTARQKYLQLQEQAYQKDVAAFKYAQLEKRFSAINAAKSMQQDILSLSEGADSIVAQATMSTRDYAAWELRNSRDNARAGLKDKRVQVEQNIMTSDAFATSDERYEALIAAHKQYRDALSAIDLQYDQQVKELAQSQHDTQMGIWQDLLSRTGSIFNEMAAMVKETAGESSAAYKAMFLVNQGISMAQALINTEVAATKAMAEGGMIAGIPMATAIRALGYASVGLIAGQTIAGMAHNGIDNIPKEGTWLLDGGERVLNPQQNKDLTSYLSQTRQQNKQSVDNKVSIIMVKDEDEAKNYKTSREFADAVVYHAKRQGLAPA